MSAVRHAVLVGELGLHEDADQVVAAVPHGGPPMTGLIMSTTFWGSVASACRMSRACSTGTPKLPVMVSIGDGRAEVDVELGAAVVDETIDEQIHGLSDPIVDPPFAVGRQERRLDQGAVSLVLSTAHRQHAVGQTQSGPLDMSTGSGDEANTSGLRYAIMQDS